MKKAYVITYKATPPHILTKVNEFRTKLDTLGSYEVIVQTPREMVVGLRAEDVGINAYQVRDALRLVIDPFKEMLLVVGIARAEFARTFNWQEFCIETSEKDETAQERNYTRFGSCHEARIAYERERPVWSDVAGMQGRLPVSFDEWCWLPPQRTGIYVRLENQKYL